MLAQIRLTFLNVRFVRSHMGHVMYILLAYVCLLLSVQATLQHNSTPACPLLKLSELKWS